MEAARDESAQTGQLWHASHRASIQRVRLLQHVRGQPAGKGCALRKDHKVALSSPRRGSVASLKGKQEVLQ